MKKLILTILCLVGISAPLLADSVLTPEEQVEIIERYMIATGQNRPIDRTAATSDEQNLPIKCGTPDILRFADEQHRLDAGLLSSMSVQAASRPIMPYYHDSPGGRIRVHFATSGPSAVYNSNVDTDGDGAPDYVEAVGAIADSVYDYTINVLGYPVPTSDAGCLGGENDRVDIYLPNLGGTYYGLTWADTACSTDPNFQVVPSWVEIDNDYQESGFGKYNSRPLDAVRVTIAHEFFHVVHFSTDAQEGRAWFEMSSVWMEEEQYDDINDYYSLLPYFYNYPRASLQSESAPVPLHNYASAVFPIYLTENYGSAIVKDIWLRSAAMGNSVNWLRAVDLAVDSASLGAASLATSIQEFAVWNYFTGLYADLAPNGIGFSEKAAYPYIPIEAMAVHTSYPDYVTSGNNQFNPQINAASYVQFQDMQNILTDYMGCDSICYDTLSIVPLEIDTFCCDSSQLIDTAFSIFLGLTDRSAMTWGLSFIIQLEEFPDSHEVLSLPPMTADPLLEIEGTERFKSITMIVTPTSVNPTYFSPSRTEGFGYYLYDTSLTEQVDPERRNVASAILTPYPNPAVVPLMGTGAAADKGKNVWLRFDLETDSQGELQYLEPYMTVDIFNVAGERVRTIEAAIDPIPLDRDPDPPAYRHEIPWDMANGAGRQVASGAYVAYVRLYANYRKNELLAEDHVKVAVIR